MLDFLVKNYGEVTDVRIKAATSKFDPHAIVILSVYHNGNKNYR